MRFSVSNIAWTYAERLGAYDILQKAGITGLEIAPGVFFSGQIDTFAPTGNAVRLAMKEISDAGLTLTSMQSLLFGVQGAALFGTTEERACFAAAMKRAIRLAGRLGIPNLVFGAPRQRVIPADMDPLKAAQVAADQIGTLAELAKVEGTLIAIESNPADYGTNFLNTLLEAREFVERLDCPEITLVLDTGAMQMNKEAAPDLSAILPRLSHVHLSEPSLAPAPAQIGPTAALLSDLRAAGYERAVSIEMIRDQMGLETVEKSVATLVAAQKLAIELALDQRSAGSLQ